jgi:osmotically-inducible protein OsmY
MKKNLLLIASGLFILAPMAQAHLFGDVTRTDAPVVVVQNQSNVRSDSDLKKAVTDAIAADRELGKFVGGFFADVSVKADKGVVTLSGTVNNESERDSIARIAKAVAGDNVINNITIKAK